MSHPPVTSRLELVPATNPLGHYPPYGQLTDSLIVATMTSTTTAHR